MARISMLEGDALLSSLLSHLSESAGFNLPMSNRDLEEQSSSEASTNNAESSRTEPLGIRTHLQLTRTVVTQYLVLLGLWQAHIGELKAAKSTVKRVHAMLDEGGVEAGEQEGWIAIPFESCVSPLTGSSSPISSFPRCSAPSIVLSTLPRTLFYAYTFLVTTIIQTDPVGKEPKCILYAAAGLASLAGKVAGSDPSAFPPFLGIGDIQPSILQMSRIHVDLMLHQAEIHIMISNFAKADKLLMELISFTRSQSLWVIYSARITVLEGMFYHSLALPRQGKAVRLAQKANVGTKRESEIEESPFQEDLEAFIKDILQDCKDSVSVTKMVGLIVEAITSGEIVRAKARLSVALQLSNSTNSQHIKPLILALLSCYFLHTRNDQAQKMLHSSHLICRSMGGSDKSKKDEHGNRIIGPETVGLARLGQWTGEQLLSVYERQNDTELAKKQRLYNAAHGDVLEGQRNLLV
ncbi:MAG: hypothetical protein CYPHOPRED_003557 [Cyphobasidiales sp. Tagirdzhanova-0007]|nr:MAG: hypothetical protein CYPHOPRED_003557 [Cyphobasidiales sp. Tagirdzhanova-0007]